MKILAYAGSHREGRLYKPLAKIQSNSEEDIVLYSSDDGIIEYVQTLQKIMYEIFTATPDVLVAGGSSSIFSFYFIILGYIWNVPVIFRIAGNSKSIHKDRLSTFLEKRKYIQYIKFKLYSIFYHKVHSFGEGFILVSPELREPTRTAFNCPDQYIKSVPNPVRSTKLAKKKDSCSKAKTQNRRLKLLTVTNLAFEGKYRGVIELLGIYSCLATTYHIEYTILGGGIYLKDLREYIDKNDIPNVNAIGFVENTGKHYKNADIFIYNSYIDAYPNVILEAQASGLPVISNPKFGMKDQIKHGKTGYLEPTGSGNFKNQLSDLIDSPLKRDRIGRNSIHKVRQINNNEYVGNLIVSEIMNLLETLDSHQGNKEE
jgi:glycosyltransferase involved in cell wall biosynthesis